MSCGFGVVYCLTADPEDGVSWPPLPELTARIVWSPAYFEKG